MGLLPVRDVFFTEIACITFRKPEPVPGCTIFHSRNSQGDFLEMFGSCTPGRKRPAPFVEQGSDAGGRMKVSKTGKTAACEIVINITPRDPGISLKSPQTVHISKPEPGEKAAVDMDIMTCREEGEGIHMLRSHILYCSASGRIFEQDEIITIRF